MDENKDLTAYTAEFKTFFIMTLLILILNMLFYLNILSGTIEFQGHVYSLGQFFAGWIDIGFCLECFFKYQSTKRRHYIFGFLFWLIGFFFVIF